MFYLLNILIQMKILLNNHTLNSKLRPFDDIGFIPTMGGIHEGHLSLIKRSKKLCKKTLVSIFVNPKQFNNKKDFKTYPSNIKDDLKILRKIKGIDFVYIPKFKDIYNSKRKSIITIKKKDKILCAKFRKGHFEGVLDVMDRLTNLIKPNRIFMGKKDYQQLFLVKRFIENKYSTKIIGCKTIRNKNKLALSSRNYLLDKDDLVIAGKLSEEFSLLKRKIKNKKNINKFLTEEKRNIQKIFNVKIEYLELRNEKNLLLSNKSFQSKIFVSYYFKNIRFIDNF
ncbi:pantoate--beta-alanine ligase [Candidatus Pelagibacter bacterium nBUS_36]|uniref:pantoate--beta-alanine ligase n=1 Tax=Candidatus Pelagibacter bacterium nBUS_36 TaxID=3374194 RepID=UPI003EBD016A